MDKLRPDVRTAVVTLTHDPKLDDPALDRALAWISDPATKVVTMTVTEKGYCHAPATGQLMLDQTNILDPRLDLNLLRVFDAVMAERNLTRITTVLGIIWIGTVVALSFLLVR